MALSADHNGQRMETSVKREVHQARPRITVFTRVYPPAYLGGGPARSLYALVEALAAEFNFSVVTSASDSSAGPMKSVKPSRWTTFSQARTWYEYGNGISASTTVKLLKATKPQLVLLNSLFDYRFSLLPLLITRSIFRRVKVVLAPRGELSPGALALKRNKKRAFIAAFRLLQLHKAVTWRASTSLEKADIERVFGSNVAIQIATDLRTDLFGEAGDQCRSKRIADDTRGGSLVFFSRIVPKKNVASAIKAMSFVKSSARLTIAGPIEDARYWSKCLKLITDLPDSGLITYEGSIPSDQVVEFLNRFDLFVLPTLGENFGHVVLESLAAGTPVIVGNDTPWHGLQDSGAGWLCNPSNPEEIARLIDHFFSLDADTQEHMRVAARNLAGAVLNDPSGLAENRLMLMRLLPPSCHD